MTMTESESAASGGDRLSDFDFDLPKELVAQEPSARRDRSRLMIVDRALGDRRHRVFAELGSELRRGDLLVLNDTRVQPFRFHGHREVTGGKVEALIVARLAEGWRVMIQARGRLLAGERLRLADRIVLSLLDRFEDGDWRVSIESLEGGDVEALLEEVGLPPLPPYIRREDADDPRWELDRERYQTVFASRSGSIAAPTAGLHFTQELLRGLDAQGIERTTVTLHVGKGTFLPVKVDDVASHTMHEERYEVTEQAAAAVNRALSEGRRVVAVGTTSCRVLESMAVGERRISAGTGTTRLFIRPPFRFRAVDALLTNFHLPRSTLLMLVSALAGRATILDAYRDAVERRYRFFSYGDAMLLTSKAGSRCSSS